MRKIKLLNWTNRSENGHSGAFKTNRFQSGFRDLKQRFQTEQTVNRKKSGFRAARLVLLCEISNFDFIFNIHCLVVFPDR